MKKFGIVSIVLVLVVTYSFCASDMGGGASAEHSKTGEVHFQRPGVHPLTEVMEKTKHRNAHQFTTLVIGASPYEAESDPERSELYQNSDIFLLSSHAPVNPTLDESRFLPLDFNLDIFNISLANSKASSRFDEILFDWSTYKFVRSDSAMARVLHNMLKKGGSVFIPEPQGMNAGGLVPTLERLIDYPQYKEVYDKYKHHLHLGHSMSEYKEAYLHDIKKTRVALLEKALHAAGFKTVRVVRSTEIQDSKAFDLIKQNVVAKNKLRGDNHEEFSVLVATKE
ncbi:MAG: hypothetical protein ACK5PQ_04895 [Alphaproteobacteria bacterium]